MNLKLISLFAASLLCALAVAVGPPYQTVFVFNDDLSDAKYSTKNNSANQLAKGYIWQQLGLNEPDGKPGTIQPNGDITRTDGVKVGSVIKDINGNAIGVASADGTKAAFDINSTNVSTEGGIHDAWEQVADNGTFVVMKHGGGKNGDAGGSVHLDGGKTFDGVVPDGSGGTGTNRGSVDNPTRGPNGPAPLRPRPGANIKVILFVCNGGTDPDQGGGRLHSVGATFRQIPGVGPDNVTDFPHVVAGKCDWRFTKGTFQEQQNARGKLYAWARSKGGIPDARSANDQDVADALAKLPANERYATANSVVDGTGACVGLSYSTDPSITVGPPPSQFVWTCPVTVDPGVALTYTFEGTPVGSSAWLHIEPGDLGGVEMFHIERIDPPAAPLGRWGTGVFDFREQDVFRPTPGLLGYELEFYGNPSRIRPVRYDFPGTMFIPVPTFTVVGNRVKFDLTGAQMVGAVELVDNVLVNSISTTKGRIVRYTVWDHLTGSAMDLHLANTGISASFELNTSEVNIDLTALGSGTMIDIRGFVRTSLSQAGVLQFQLLNRVTNVYDTVFTGGTSNVETAFNVMGTPMANYFDANRNFKLRVRSKIPGPIPVSEFFTDFGMLEVVSY